MSNLRFNFSVASIWPILVYSFENDMPLLLFNNRFLILNKNFFAFQTKFPFSAMFSLKWSKIKFVWILLDFIYKILILMSLNIFKLLCVNIYKHCYPRVFFFHSRLRYANIFFWWNYKTLLLLAETLNFFRFAYFFMHNIIYIYYVCSNDCWNKYT